MKSCLGCGQMLVAVPAGGGWVHLSLALPISLFSAVEEATDGVRRFSLQSQRCFFSLSSALPPWLEGNVPGKHEDGARHPALHRRKGQLLTERGRPLRLFLLQTLCYLPVDVCNSYSFALKTWWNGRNSLSRQNMPSQGLSAMPNLK